jgi:hypothetical protein
MNPINRDTLIDHVRQFGGRMDREQAADLLGITPRTLSRWLRAGELPGLTLGSMPKTGHRGHPRAAVVLAGPA